MEHKDPMADAPAPGPYTLKHRLTGATLILLVAVLLIPMLLSTPEADKGATTTANREPDDNFQSKIEMLAPATQHSAAQPEVTESPIPVVTESTTQAADSAAAQAVAEPDATEPTSGWSIQIGIFAKAENVDSVTRLLTREGFRPRHTEVQTNSGLATRIWLGPYTDKDEAEAVGAILQSLTNEKVYINNHAS